MLKSLIASALLVAGSAAFAAPQLQQVVDRSQEGLERRVWSSVCVGNTELEGAVKAEYQWGAEGEWKAIEIKPNTLVIFSQRYSTDFAPMKFTLKFKSPQTDDGADVAYELSQTETRLRPRSCDSVENYRFEGTDDPAGAIDLVHVQ